MRSNKLRLGHIGLLPKLVFSFMLFGVVFLVTFSFICYYSSRLALEEEMNTRLISAARAVAKSIPYETLSLLSYGQKDSLTYRSLLHTLNNFKEAMGVERIFIFDPNTYYLLADTKTKAINFKYHRLLQDRHEINLAAKGMPSASTMFRGPTGRFYKSGYAAIETPSGTAAIVGVEADVQFFDTLVKLKRTLVVSLLVVLLLFAVAAYVLALRIRKPVVELVSAANRITEGNLQAEIDIPSKDEIGFLARSLEDMRKAILQRDETLQLLLRAVAHEVRNPLGSIGLSLDLLAEDLGDNQQYKRRLSQIREELNVLNRLVSGFLEYARRWEVAPQKTNILSLFEHAWAQVSPELKGSISIEMSISPDLTWVVDKNQLGIAALNLLINSCQALQGKGKIKVTARQEGDSLVIDISDSGSGVPENLREKIFEPFFSTRAKGSGLGLALVKKVVNLHHGKIKVETSSELGGASFVIVIPKLEEHYGKDINSRR